MANPGLKILHLLKEGKVEELLDEVDLDDQLNYLFENQLITYNNQGVQITDKGMDIMNDNQ